MRSAVVLGGYGNFGKRVVAALAADRVHRVVVAGRDFQQASAVADSVGFPAEPVALDLRAVNFDLADARAYVCGIGALDEAARRNDVLIVSGASSVPALSSAVIDFLRPEFAQVDSIDVGTGIETDVNTLAERLRAAAGSRSALSHGPAKSGE